MSSTASDTATTVATTTRGRRRGYSEEGDGDDFRTSSQPTQPKRKISSTSNQQQQQQMDPAKKKIAQDNAAMKKPSLLLADGVEGRPEQPSLTATISTSTASGITSVNTTAATDGVGAHRSKGYAPAKTSRRHPTGVYGVDSGPQLADDGDDGQPRRYARNRRHGGGKTMMNNKFHNQNMNKNVEGEDSDGSGPLLDLEETEELVPPTLNDNGKPRKASVRPSVGLPGAVRVAGSHGNDRNNDVEQVSRPSDATHSQFQSTVSSNGMETVPGSRMSSLSTAGAASTPPSLAFQSSTSSRHGSIGLTTLPSVSMSMSSIQNASQPIVAELADDLEQQFDDRVQAKVELEVAERLARERANQTIFVAMAVNPEEEVPSNMSNNNNNNNTANINGAAGGGTKKDDDDDSDDENMICGLQYSCCLWVVCLSVALILIGGLIGVLFGTNAIGSNSSADTAVDDDETGLAMESPRPSLQASVPPTLGPTLNPTPVPTAPTLLVPAGYLHLNPRESRDSNFYADRNSQWLDDGVTEFDFQPAAVAWAHQQNTIEDAYNRVVFNFGDDNVVIREVVVYVPEYTPWGLTRPEAVYVLFPSTSRQCQPEVNGFGSTCAFDLTLFPADTTYRAVLDTEPELGIPLHSGVVDAGNGVTIIVQCPFGPPAVNGATRKCGLTEVEFYGYIDDGTRNPTPAPSQAPTSISYINTPLYTIDANDPTDDRDDGFYADENNVALIDGINEFNFQRNTVIAWIHQDVTVEDSFHEITFYFDLNVQVVIKEVVIYVPEYKPWGLHRPEGIYVKFPSSSASAGGQCQEHGLASTCPVDLSPMTENETYRAVLDSTRISTTTAEEAEIVPLNSGIINGSLNSNDGITIIIQCPQGPAVDGGNQKCGIMEVEFYGYIVPT